MKSIKTKLVVAFTFLVISITAVMGLTSINSGSSLLKSNTQQTVQLLSDDAAKLVKSRLDVMLSQLSGIASQSSIESMILDNQLEALKDQIHHTPFIDLAVVQPDGTATYTDGSVSQLGDREYIDKALHGQPNISDVIISKVTGEPVVMVAVPIHDKGEQVVGVLIGRMDGNTLSEITNDTGFGKLGYGYMINIKGQVVAHPDKKLVLEQFNPIKKAADDTAFKTLADAEQSMIANKTGYIEYSYDKADLLAGYSQVPGTDWIVIVTANRNEVLSSIRTLQIKIGIIIVLSLFFGILIVYFIGNTISKPIMLIAKLSDKIASLDLSDNVPVKYLKWKDENGILARAMQDISKSLRSIVNEITTSSMQVSSTAQELTATAEQSSSASEEVSLTVEEIAKGSTEQAANTERGSVQAMKLGEIIDRNKEYLFNMNRASEKITGMVKEGLQEIDRLAQISEESSTAVNEIYDIIHKTSQSSNQIGEASNVITSLADQTNLLALNASIEAARAGEAGKGFAVVAQEIKKLAGQSASSTSYIDRIVQELQEIVSKAVNSIERVNMIAKEQSQSVSTTKQKYKAIRGAAEESENEINQLNESEEEMLTAKNDILNMLQTLSAIAQENAAGTEEASSAMLEQSASIDEIAKSSERLASLSISLQEIIQKFKL